MKVVIIAIVLAALLGTGAFFMTRSQDSTSQTAPTETTDQTMTTTPTPITGSAQTYTLVDIAQHAKAEDCWMAINGKVYNATDYVTQHPGGKAIVKGCGTDASVLFNERPSEQKGPHPAAANTALEQLYIGDLK